MSSIHQEALETVGEAAGLALLSGDGGVGHGGGCVIRDSTPPGDSAKWKSFVAFIAAHAASVLP